jgi:hypothetical protein
MNKLNVKYESIDWTIQTIIDSEESIDWDIFCENFKANLEDTSDSDISLYYFNFFHLFKEKINWSAFCKNKDIHWSHFLRTIFPHQIKNQYRQNYNITNEINLFSFYFDKWDWNEMSSNEHIPHNIWTYIFTNHKNTEAIPKLNFKKLSSLKNIPWDLTLHYMQEKNSVLDYSDQWDWEEIVTNKSIKWNKKMILDHASHFPWAGHSGGSTGKYWYIPSILSKCGHINFPSKVLKEHTSNWLEGMYDGCTRSDSEGDWIVFSRNHNINIDILNEFGSKLDLGEVVKNKMNWSIEELILIKNILREKKLWHHEYQQILKTLISKENVKELILIEMLKKI